MKLIFDVETNDFVSDATKVHCIVIKNIDTNKFYSYKYDEIEKALKLLSDADLLVGHNISKFDLLVIKKLYPDFKYKAKIFDTLLVSRLIWTNRKEEDFRLKEVPTKLIGRHSLEAWGYRLGLRKGDFIKTGDFSKWSQEMQNYCKLDVEVTAELYNLILKQNYSPEAIELEHNFAECIIRQEAHGFSFDVASAKKLYASLANRRLELEAILASAFPNWKKFVGTFRPKRDNKKKGYKVGVSIKRYKEQTFNPNSRDHISDRLMARGWKPKVFTPDGKPKVDETVLNSLPYKEAKILAEHFLIQKRISQLAEGKQAWLKLERNNKIYGKVIENGAISGRCTHNSPNVANVPSNSVPFGTECRSLFIAPDDFSLVGCDVASLELSLLAHFLFPYDDGNFKKSLLEGDIHSKNRETLGLALRSQAKTTIYAFIYGAGNQKLGQIIEGSIKEGKELRRKLLEKIPALKKLRDDALITFRNKKYLLGLDKRKLLARSEHSILNLLIQSAGSLIVKQATIILHRKFKENDFTNNDVNMVAHIHDELQIESKSSLADSIGKLAVKSVQEAGEHFKIRLPVTAKYKIGKNWSETH
jgi:DNA polymerase I-like protein with 3'-5' exonuclease and polymerase domains